ncbi:MAG: M64 family metallopeptidase, partial [Bacteroidales bacterium]
YNLYEKKKFLTDVDSFRNYLFSMEPYKSHRDKFNIHAALSLSEHSGTDNPGISNWIDTPVETSFYTFGSERYLTTAEYWKISDIAMNIPFDQVVILVNTDKYGGGGIYNHYSIFSSDHALSKIVFIHEFGHGFVGLGDEYYDSEVAYESFYDLDSEPLPPNLTTLVNFDSKWKDMVEEGVPIPTPINPDYADKVGAFEGGGYVAKGVYRPQVECRMKSNDAPGFCKVCQKAILDLIKYYSE